MWWYILSLVDFFLQGKMVGGRPGVTHHVIRLVEEEDAWDEERVQIHHLLEMEQIVRAAAQNRNLATHSHVSTIVVISYIIQSTFSPQQSLVLLSW